MARTFRPGDRVTVAQTQLCGTVKFIGATEFAAGEWMGIELDEKAGKNNGSVKGKCYFDCKPEHGLFVRPTAVTKIQEAQPEAVEPLPEVNVQKPPPGASLNKTPPPPAVPAASAPKVTLQPALLVVPQPHASSPPRRISKVEEGDKTREVEKAGVQLELAQAMEDHDADSIRRLLPVAMNLGLPPEEISAARRILSWEVRQTMQEEVDAVCSSISQLAQSITNLEVRASKKTQSDSRAVIGRLGTELERRVWEKLESKIHSIVESAMAKVPARPVLELEAFRFEHFDLNGDGIITRDEFEEARQMIMAGHGGKTFPPAAKVAEKLPQKIDATRPQREQAPRAVMRQLYSQAAQRLQVLERASKHPDVEAAQLVVKHLIQKGLQKALLMAPHALAEAQQDIAAIRASKQRIEDATKRAEERVNAASTKVQAMARGRQARQKKDLLEKSAVTLQRALRRLRQQWHQGKKMDFVAVVRAVKGQRREWAMEFQRVAGEDGLVQQPFVEALTRACGESVSSLQAEKLWMGYLQQSEQSGPMVLATFWAICDAVLQGDVQAAEFADMTVEEYVSYGQAAEHWAAQKIQAAHLGRKIRQQPTTEQALEQAAARIQAAHLGRVLRHSVGALEAVPADIRP